ncbi:iron ABC transporter permease [Shouchella sp. 1P09AA]|uniref:FecCD family ABC transporter permease n=1 Tax=unclassified Shouchella TaxID=2893065 RepID=UPI0039A32D6B
MMTRSLSRKKYIGLLFMLVFLVFLTNVGSMLVGAGSFNLDRLIQTILGNGNTTEDFLLFSIKFPRMVVLLLAGVALALSGSILQSLTRNDLADPGIIGINAGAGVAIAIFFLYVPLDPGTFAFSLPLVAFVGAVLTALCIYVFSYTKGIGVQAEKLVLVGIGFAMALSGLMIVLISSADHQKVDFIANWLAGSVWGTSWVFVWTLLPWVVILFPFILFKARELNLFSIGRSSAIALGVPIKRDSIILLFVAVALAAAAVSITGGIAFIGLMAPHLAKTLVGPKHQRFIPVAALIGAWLLCLADSIARNAFDVISIPTGVVVSLIGGPFFLYLLLRKKRPV